MKKSASTPVKKATKDNSGSTKSSLMIIGGFFVLLVPILAVVYQFYNKASSPVAITSTASEMSAKLPVHANPDGKPREATKSCIDRHKQCKQFADGKACEQTPGWMVVNCPQSCNTCHLRDPAIRCDRQALDMDNNPIYQPGDMNKMFESLISKYSSKYDINIISRSPWVVTFDNFLSDKEVAALIKTVKRWERSTDVGTTNEIGETGRVLSTGRTSSNSWCDKDCESHPNVKQVLKKIETITGVPKQNYESFQILRYEIGQKYDTHHDYGADDIGLACGPRILTFFLYLSDVEEGGETAFPTLNITVKPKKGRALLWPSTLDEDPEQIDARTMHAALPVIKGKKFAANSWIHLYNYEEPNRWGCTGTFDDLEE